MSLPSIQSVIIPIIAGVSYLLYRKHQQLQSQSRSIQGIPIAAVPEPPRQQSSRLVTSNEMMTGAGDQRKLDVNTRTMDKNGLKVNDAANRFGLVGDSSPVGTGILGYGWAGTNPGPKLQRSTQIYNQS